MTAWQLHEHSQHLRALQGLPTKEGGRRDPTTTMLLQGPTGVSGSELLHCTLAVTSTAPSPEQAPLVPLLDSLRVSFLGVVVTMSDPAIDFGTLCPHATIPAVSCFHPPQTAGQGEPNASCGITNGWVVVDLSP